MGSGHMVHAGGQATAKGPLDNIDLIFTGIILSVFKLYCSFKNIWSE